MKNLFFCHRLGFWKLLLYELHTANVGYGVHEVVFLEGFPLQTHECVCVVSSISPVLINCTHMLQLD